MDQIANKPIPITAKIDEKITAISLNAEPKIKEIISTAIKNNATDMYLLIRLILASLIPFLRATLVIVK